MILEQKSAKPHVKVTGSPKMGPDEMFQWVLLQKPDQKHDNN